MKTVFQRLHHLSPVFLLVSIVSTDAKYCTGNETSACCSPHAGLGNPTCRGVGTSDISDLIGVLVQGGETYGILGQPEGIYYIFGVSYKLLKGVEAVLNLETLYAYIIEVPDLKKGGHIYYYIPVGGCPSVSILTANSKETMPGTRLPLGNVYKLIQATNREPDCAGPCNTITGASPPNYSTGPFPELDLNIPLSFSSAYALQYHCLNTEDSHEPTKVVREHDLDIEQGNCSSLYVQKGYMDGAELCFRGDKGTPTGRFLANNFDFSRLSQKNGLCLLVTLLNKLGASFPYPYYLYHEKLRLLSYPYNCAVTVSCYLSENVGYQMNEPLANLC